MNDIYKYRYPIGIGVGLLVFSIITYINRNRIKKGLTMIAEKVSDAISESRIETLHPSIRNVARNFINEAEKQGIKLRVTSALRTFAEQDELYAQGRTKPGNIVTNARGGFSNHNFGLAFDVVPIVNGKAQWNSKDWNKIGQIGKSFGFVWGGDWKGLVDKPHFEMMFGNTLAQLRNKYTSGDKQGNYVNV
jgi:peptidoglycan L-alanyl-D-glutamate endopeptidase CwlK